MLKETIIDHIINGYEGKSRPIDGLPPGFEAVSFRLRNEFSVAIPYDGMVVIDESFANASLRSTCMSIGSGDFRPFLTFSSNLTDYEHNEIFALMCENFIDTDSNGERRKAITSDPFSWWENWKTVVGNAEKDKESYPIIAEMISLDYMVVRGYDPVWEGPNNTTVDIRSSSFDCEVKSSISRYNDEITLSSQLQLLITDRPLHLYYCSFQESGAGLSIEDMVARLVLHGVNSDNIEKSLSRMNCPVGSASRMRKYQLLKMWDFLIDDSFPKIVPNSFKGDAVPKGIKKIQYTIDLRGLDYNELEYR